MQNTKNGCELKSLHNLLSMAASSVIASSDTQDTPVFEYEVMV